MDVSADAVAHTGVRVEKIGKVLLNFVASHAVEPDVRMVQLNNPPLERIEQRARLDVVLSEIPFWVHFPYFVEKYKTLFFTDVQSE